MSLVPLDTELKAFYIQQGIVTSGMTQAERDQALANAERSDAQQTFKRQVDSGIPAAIAGDMFKL